MSTEEAISSNIDVNKARDSGLAQHDIMQTALLSTHVGSCISSSLIHKITFGLNYFYANKLQSRIFFLIFRFQLIFVEDFSAAISVKLPIRLFNESLSSQTLCDTNYYQFNVNFSAQEFSI